jgi:hypothetical protein
MLTNVRRRPGGGGVRITASDFFSENVIAITMTFTWMIHTSFAITKPFFLRVSVLFNTILLTLSKMLYTSAVKSSDWTGDHITSRTRKVETKCDNTSVNSSWPEHERRSFPSPQCLTPAYAHVRQSQKLD